jgi:hypothetical protein
MESFTNQALDREIALITAALRHEFPELSQRVQPLVRDVTTEILAAARIPTSLPVLIHRRARWRLKHLRVEEQPTWVPAEPGACTSSARERLSIRLRRR